MAIKKKADKTGKITRKKRRTSAVWKNYEVKGDELIRKNQVSPKAPGCFMAEHKDRRTCGRSGYMEKKA